MDWRKDGQDGYATAAHFPFVGQTWQKQAEQHETVMAFCVFVLLCEGLDNDAAAALWLLCGMLWAFWHGMATA